MDLTIEDRVRAWIGRQAPAVTAARPAVVHVDELLEAEDSSLWYRVAVQALAAISLTCDALQNLVPTLVLPLGTADRLSVDCPAWTELEELLVEEPPSLALVHIDAWRVIDRAEEYRRYVEVPSELLVSSQGQHYVAYYRCFRSEEALRNGWEYERCIYIEVVETEQWLKC